MGLPGASASFSGLFVHVSLPRGNTFVPSTARRLLLLGVLLLWLLLLVRLLMRLLLLLLLLLRLLLLLLLAVAPLQSCHKRMRWKCVNWGSVEGTEEGKSTCRHHDDERAF